MMFSMGIASLGFEMDNSLDRRLFRTTGFFCLERKKDWHFLQVWLRSPGSCGGILVIRGRNGSAGDILSRSAACMPFRLERSGIRQKKPAGVLLPASYYNISLALLRNRYA
jgi:hypothetical protein